MANYQVRQFESSIRNWIKRVENDLDSILIEFVTEVHTALVRGSPVLTGRFRANWQITANRIPLHALNEYDKIGDKTIERGRREATALIRGGGVTTIYFSNMLIYANALEYGHSKQAPAGVLGIVAIRLGSFMTAAIKNARASNAVR